MGQPASPCCTVTGTAMLHGRHTPYSSLCVAPGLQSLPKMKSVE